MTKWSKLGFGYIFKRRRELKEKLEEDKLEIQEGYKKVLESLNLKHPNWNWGENVNNRCKTCFGVLIDGKCPYCKNSEESKNGCRSIPKSVQREVWRRDNGRCVECGSKEFLEFDHIIPYSKGGSNTARNIQLLCEQCNRKKGNAI